MSSGDSSNVNIYRKPYRHVMERSLRAGQKFLCHVIVLYHHLMQLRLTHLEAEDGAAVIPVVEEEVGVAPEHVSSVDRRVTCLETVLKRGLEGEEDGVGVGVEEGVEPVTSVDRRVISPVNVLMEDLEVGVEEEGECRSLHIHSPLTIQS